MGKKTSFNKDWLLDEAFSDWCRENETDKFSATFIKCNRSFSLSNMGRQALVTHMQGTKHRSSCQNLAKSYKKQTFFSKSSNSKKLGFLFSILQPINVFSSCTTLFNKYVIFINYLHNLNVNLCFFRNKRD